MRSSKMKKYEEPHRERMGGRESGRTNGMPEEKKT